MSCWRLDISNLVGISIHLLHIKNYIFYPFIYWSGSERKMLKKKKWNKMFTFPICRLPISVTRAPLAVHRKSTFCICLRLTSPSLTSHTTKLISRYTGLLQNSCAAQIVFPNSSMNIKINLSKIDVKSPSNRGSRWQQTRNSGSDRYHSGGPVKLLDLSSGLTYK